MIGQRLADRYELLDEGPRALGGRLFRARDLAFDEIVAVKQISGHAGGQGCLQGLDREVRRIQRFTHPALVRHDALDIPASLLVREWIHGFSLLELLKRRRELRADEALRLLDGLPAAFDFAAENNLALPRQILGKLLIEFEKKIVPDEFATQPLQKWPPFALRLNPLSVRGAVPDADSEGTMTTLTDLPSPASDSKVNAPERLAGLLYELLGGPNRSGRTRRYTPLPALHEEGNGVLRRALLDSPFSDCRSLWSDLVLAEPSDFKPGVPLAAMRHPPEVRWHRPATLPVEGQHGSVLRLVPVNPALPAVHLIARPTFSIGRSLFHADFIARLLPATPANEELTNQLSRIHVLAEAAGARLTLRDGNGDSPSVNGTTLDEQPLPGDHATSLTHRVLLTLGGVYSLEVVPVLLPAPRPIIFAETESAAEAPAMVPGPGGAVFFLPAPRQPVVRDAVWLFSQAGFGLDATQRIVWDLRPGTTSPAAFYLHRGGFWLGNHRLPEDTLAVAGISLRHGEIAPLRKGQSLRAGALQFKIEID